jgi:hypothetical protein
VTLFQRIDDLIADRDRAIDLIVLAAVREMAARGGAYHLAICRATGYRSGRVTRSLFRLEMRGDVLSRWAGNVPRPRLRLYYPIERGQVTAP